MESFFEYVEVVVAVIGFSGVANDISMHKL
jgi:hypothetical protein